MLLSSCSLRQAAAGQAKQPVCCKAVAGPAAAPIRRNVAPITSRRSAAQQQRTLPVLRAAETAEQETAPAPVPEEPQLPSGPKEARAVLRFQRGSVFKVRRVLDTIRGRPYEEALVLMEYMPYRACESILKVLLSAAANAKHNTGALKTRLVVSECYADQGPYIKRFQPRAKGRACMILKPTFHMTIKVKEMSQ